MLLGKALVTVNNQGDREIKIRNDTEIVEIEGKKFIEDGVMEEGVRIGKKCN